MRKELKKYGKLKKEGKFSQYLEKLLENKEIRNALTESLKEKIRK
jgi:predicted component of type VI protein secretion system